MMIRIITSQKNLPEKKYIFDVIFNEFLGIEYEIIIRPEERNYVIELINHRKIIIEDHFWNRIKGDELSYLNHDFLPGEINYSPNQFTFEEDLPVLYGNPVVNTGSDNIICSIDIFATIYFFLSRWEEFISEDFDFAGRFKYKNSISAKFDLLHRPIVNELIEFLWKMLLYCDYKGIRKEHQFTPVISHDIDQPIRLYNLKMLSKTIGKNIFVQKNILGAIQNLLVYPINKITPKFDLANSYEFLMDVSESIGTKSYFNFQAAKKTKYHWGYDNSKFILNTINNIKNRGHLIGYHPGFYTLDDQDLWKEEYNKLCRITNMKVMHGRQHYLRFKVPFTWQIWDDNGLESDSTLGYSEKEGFRCGTCYQYSVYNFLTRKKLNLKETPLLLMDATLMNSDGFSKPILFLDKFNALVKIVKKYGGNFVFLWHNSSFDRSIYTRNFYKELIRGLSLFNLIIFCLVQ